MKYIKPTIRVVELNISEVCNRHCIFCPRADESVYPNDYTKHMTPNTFTDILNALQTSNYDGIISISGFSEPLLGKYLMEGLAILTPHFPVRVITNFDMMTVDILKQFDAMGLYLLKIDLYDGEHQLRRLEGMLSEYNYGNSLSIRKIYETSDDCLDFYNRGGSSTFDSIEGMDINRHCNVPFTKIMIDWNGNYIQCMSDWFRESEISKAQYNVKSISINEYLESALYRKFIASMTKSQRNNLIPCKTCDIRGVYK